MPLSQYEILDVLTNERMIRVESGSLVVNEVVQHGRYGVSELWHPVIKSLRRSPSLQSRSIHGSPESKTVVTCKK